MMRAGIVLDTSFLITLADSTRKHHQAARGYWRHLTENAVPIFLPTIVVSEFCIRQEIPPEMVQACIVLPFNWEEAILSAKLDFSKADRVGESRDALKDDVKILAQAIVNEAAWVITEDSRSFFKFAERLKTNGHAAFRPLKLEDGFDPAVFTPLGQREFDFDLEEEEPDDDA